MKTLSTSLILLSILTSGCNDSSDPAKIETVETIKTTSSLLIEAVPASLGDDYTNNFDRYTKLDTPDGGEIHILAQDQITEGQIIRVRNILLHYLSNMPGSKYGSDKSAIANKMAENGARMILLNGTNDGSNPVAELEGQALYENEIQVEGHIWYIEQDYDHRDASFEKVLHLVHNAGIGIDGNNEFIGILPAFQTEIRAAQENAYNNALWGVGEANWASSWIADWIADLTTENKLSQEYIASVIDSYYGLWGAWGNSITHGMWGVYTAKTRDEISTEDPVGAALINNTFFHSYLTYDAQIDASFVGTFSLSFYSGLPYTHHSQYLKDVTLTGTNDSNVKVNQLDNHITGNSGVNIVEFSANYSEYSITRNSTEIIVTDNQADRDGTNTLINIERLQFPDQFIDTADL